MTGIFGLWRSTATQNGFDALRILIQYIPFEFSLNLQLYFLLRLIYYCAGCNIIIPLP